MSLKKRKNNYNSNKNNKHNTTDVLYKGEVEFSLKINGKLYAISKCNAGTTFLKYLFAKMLYGEYNSDDAPYYVDIWYKNNSGDILQFTKTKIKISGRLLIDLIDGLYTTVSFTAYIRFDDLREAVNAEDTSKYWFYLFPKEGTTHLAQISVSPLNLSYITAGTSATLTWNLRLINYEEY